MVIDRKGEYDSAIDDSTKEVELNPNHAEAYYNRGNAYLAKKDYEIAIENYNKAIELNPKYADAYNNLGNLYWEKKDYDNAIENYSKAIELNPKGAMAYSNRGNGYWVKKDYDSAIDDYNKAIELNPKYAGTYHYRGFAYLAKKDYDSAIENYSKEIELNSKYAGAYYYRGTAYSAKKDYDSAIADFTKAIEIKPDFLDAYEQRGAVKALKNRGEEESEKYLKDEEKKLKRDIRINKIYSWLAIIMAFSTWVYALWVVSPFCSFSINVAEGTVMVACLSVISGAVYLLIHERNKKESLLKLNGKHRHELKDTGQSPQERRQSRGEQIGESIWVEMAYGQPRSPLDVIPSFLKQV